MSSPYRLVIIGNGMAGARLVADVLARRGSRAFDIVVFGDEPHGAYNRILLSGVLAGTHDEGDVMTHPRAWFEREGVVLHAGVRAIRVDLAARQVYGDDGGAASYDALVFATGAVPFVPPIDGLVRDDGTLLPGAFTFRTLDDCARMIERSSRTTRAVVVGGGLLGLEAARALAGRGLDVSIVHLAPHLMDAQLDTPASEIVRRQVEALGLRVLTGRTTRAVLGRDRIEGVCFADGDAVPCDMLVIAAGVRPDVALAAQAGLAVRHGILVGDDLACHGHAGVFAIGDCAEHRGQVHGLVAPGWEQASVLADRLTGRRPAATYAGSRLSTKLKVAGLDVAVMGDKDEGAGVDVVSYAEPSRGLYRKLLVRDNRLIGAILIGGGRIVPGVAQAFLESIPLPSERADLLFPPATDPVAGSIEQMPDTAGVCDCNAVTKGTIVDAVLSGATSLRAVCERTRAGTGCGSCRPEVERILNAVRETMDRLSARAAVQSEEAAPAGHAAS